MNTVWSEKIQGILTLYLSRRLRFNDLFFPQYDALFSLNREKPLSILEIGCGPGALAEALCRWYPAARITGLDRDTNFIRYAREHVPGAVFLEGDAGALPFEDGSLDVTVSNTVSEHIAPGLFYPEQLRVLKPGGVCLVLSARKGFVHRAPCTEETKEEHAFWERLSGGENELEKYGVGRYAASERELPLTMERYGFSDVAAGYAVIDLTPDHPRYPRALSEEMIAASRASRVESVLSTGAEGAEEIAGLIGRQYDERLSLLRRGEHQWDTVTSVTMVIRGVKPE